MKNILITGGTGLIGSRLTEMLSEQNYAVGWLSRKPIHAYNVQTFLWNIQKEYIDTTALEWADAIVHLAGEGIATKRWTPKRKKEIIESRVNSAVLLNKCLLHVPNKVKTIIASSAIGFYGDGKNKKLTEESKHGDGFLTDSCLAWEQATAQFKNSERRLVTFRIGIVLTKNGGALKELIKTIPFGIAPVLGNGKQIYSWIHLEDLCKMILFGLQNNSISGTYNATAPHPVSQKELMRDILLAWDKKAILAPVPGFILRLVLGEMSNTVLMSQNISSEKIVESGFAFQFPSIQSALVSMR